MHCVKHHQTTKKVEQHCLQSQPSWGRDVAHLVEHWTSSLLIQVWFPSAARDFSSRVIFQCRLYYNVCTPPCAWVNICVHMKDPVVHVRVWWILETLKHPAGTVGWLVWVCQGKQPEFYHGRNPIGTIQLKKILKLKVRVRVRVWNTFMWGDTVKPLGDT